MNASADGCPPLAEDIVVRELDVYAAAPPSSSEMYLLQFPLREQDRGYESVQRVRLKPNVQKMEWMLPLDRRSPTYNVTSNKPEISGLTGMSLQSSQVDPESEGFAAAVRYGNDICLVPLSHFLQLRYSPSYLDKEKDRDRADLQGTRGVVVRGGAAADGRASRSIGGGITMSDMKEELAPITVQVKRHETEQQTEARLRSYAFHAQREEADTWVELDHHPMSSDQSKHVLQRIHDSVRGSPVASQFYDPVNYLYHITPGANDDVAQYIDGDRQQQLLGMTPGEGLKAIATDPAKFLQDLGRPSADEKDMALPSQIMKDFTSALGNLFANVSSVLSLADVRTMLGSWQGNPTLVSFVHNASDGGLHEAIMQRSEVECIRERYVLRHVGSPAIDPLRSLVLELLRAKDHVKRGEVSSLAETRGVVMNDPLYTKIMKELCLSKGSTWSLKPSATSL